MPIVGEIDVLAPVAGYSPTLCTGKCWASKNSCQDGRTNSNDDNTGPDSQPTLLPRGSDDKIFAIW